MAKGRLSDKEIQGLLNEPKGIDDKQLDGLLAQTRLGFTDPLSKDYNIDPSAYDFSLRGAAGNQYLQAELQSGFGQFGNALGRVALNTIPEVVGNIASALDFEDYMNVDDEVGNWLTNWMNTIKESTNESFPIHRKNPGKPLDVGDSGWWFENGGALAQSALGFVGTGYLTGMGLGSILSRGASATKWLSTAGKTAQVGEFGQGIVQGGSTLANSILLNQAESIGVATSVYNDVYNQYVERIGDEAARQKAADAASYSVNINRANILLNLTSAGMFTRSPRVTRQILNNVSKKRTAKHALLESGQEAAEEEINLLAEKAGISGKRVDEVLGEMFTKEGLEAGILGAVGGGAQTMLTAAGRNIAKPVFGVKQEDGTYISRNEDMDRRYNEQVAAVDDFNEILSNNNLKDVTDSFNDFSETLQLRNDIADAIANEEDDKAEELKSKLLEAQAFKAFDTGSTESLLKVYQSIGSLSEEEATAKGIFAGESEKDPNHYKNKAKTAIDTITELENVYVDARKYANLKEVYSNRASYIRASQSRQEIDSDTSTTYAKLQSKLQQALNDGAIKDTYRDKKLEQDIPIPYALSDLDDDSNIPKVAGGAARRAYNKMVKQIKAMPEYNEFAKNNEALKSFDEALNSINDEHRVITSKGYQEAYVASKKRQEEIKTEERKKNRSKARRQSSKGRNDVKRRTKRDSPNKPKQTPEEAQNPEPKNVTVQTQEEPIAGIPPELVEELNSYTTAEGRTNYAKEMINVIKNNGTEDNPEIKPIYNYFKDIINKYEVTEAAPAGSKETEDAADLLNSSLAIGKNPKISKAKAASDNMIKFLEALDNNGFNIDNFGEVAQYMKERVGTARFREIFQKFKDLYNFMNPENRSELSYENVFNLSNATEEIHDNYGTNPTDVYTDATQQSVQDGVNDTIEQVSNGEHNLVNVNEEGEPEYENDRVKSGHSIVAYLSREYVTRVTVDDDGIIKIKKEDRDDLLNSNILDKNILDPDQFQVGESVTLRIDKDFKLEESSGNILNYDALLERERVTGLKNGYIPIAIYRNGAKVGYLHSYEWINSANVAGDIELERANLMKIRNHVVKLNSNGKNYQTTIKYKSNGKFAKAVNNHQKPVSERFPDPSLEFAVGKNGHFSVNGIDNYNENNSKVVQFKNVKEGVLYTFPKVGIDRKTKKNIHAAVGLGRSKVSEDYAKSIVKALRIYVKKDTESPVRKALIDDYGIDVTTYKGITEYVNLFIHNFNVPDGKTFSEAIADYNSDAYMFSIQPNSIEFARGKRVEYGTIHELTPTRKVSQLLSTLETYLTNMYMRFDVNRFEDEEFSLPVIEGETVRDANQGRSYISHVKDTAVTNLLSFELGNDKYAYTIQPVIELDTSDIVISSASSPAAADSDEDASSQSSSSVSSPTGNSVDFDDFGDEVSYAISKTGNIKNVITKVSNTALISGFSPVQQESIVSLIAGDIYEKLRTEKSAKNTVFNEWRKFFEKLEKEFESRIESNPELYKQKVEEVSLVLSSWDRIKYFVTNRLSKIANVTLNETEDEGLFIDEVESEVQKESFDSERSLKIDSKNSASRDLKMFLAFIEDRKPDGTLRKNYLGLSRIVPFDIVYNDLSAILSKSPADYDSMIAEIELNTEAKPYLMSVLEKLDEADEQIQNEFVVSMSKHYVEMMYVNLNKNKKGFSLTPSKSNSNAVSKVLLNDWYNKFKGSKFVTTNADDKMILNRTQLKPYLDTAREWQEKDAIPPEASVLKSWLSDLGIELSAFTLDQLEKGRHRRFGKEIFYETQFKGRVGFIRNIVDNLSTALDNGLEFDDAIMHNDPSLQSIARLESRATNNSFSNSHRNMDSETVFSYSNNKYLSERARDLVTDDNLLSNLNKTAFSKVHPKAEYASYWLKQLMTENSHLRSVFGMFYVDGMVEFGSNSTRFKNMGDIEQEVYRLGMFQNKWTTRGKGKNEKRIIRALYPTMSDKSMMVGFNTVAYDTPFIDNKLSSEAYKAVYEALVIPEINRMIELQEQNIDIKAFNEGVSLFYFVPELNDSDFNVTKNQQEYNRLVKEGHKKEDAARAADTKYPTLFIDDKLNPEVLTDARLQNHIYTTVKQHVDNLIKEKKKYWEENGVADDKFSFVDDKYRAGALANMTVKHKDEAPALLKEYMAADYVINSLIANANFHQLFIGDPAMFYKPGKAKTNFEKVFNTYINIGKRLAGDNASGTDVAKSADPKETITYAFAKDANTPSVAMKEYKKVLKDKASAYSDIEGTDAQEYITLKEKLRIMELKGELTQDEINKVRSAISRGRDIDSSIVKKVIGPDKPVYVNNIMVNDGGNSPIMERRLYVKSAAFTLVPQLTKGLEIDKIRQAMEDQNIDRLAFDSAVKVGGRRESASIFDKSGKVVDDLSHLSNHTLNDVPRKGFRIQQEVPNDPSKDSVNDGTQQRKLLFQNLLSNKKFKDLFDTYNNTYKEIFNYHRKELLDELGISDDGKVDINKLQSLLRDEAIKRDYPINDVEGLRIDSKTGEFSIPLWASLSGIRYEALLTSIVDNRVRKIKAPGRSLVLVSEEGFRSIPKAETGITFTSSWTGKLKRNQVIVPFKFKDRNGNILSIKDYLDEDGNINTEKLPTEMLEGFGYRIPTQGHNSMIAIEIVGFLPEYVDDVVIASRDLTKQMGSDFDVDKLYLHEKAYYVDKDGNVVPMNFDNEVEGINVLKENGYNYTKARQSWSKSKFNTLLDIHLEVLKDASVQEQIMTPIGFGQLKTNEDTGIAFEIEKLRNDRDDKDMVFSPLSESYQKEKYLSASSAASAIGVFALDNVFNAVVQDKDIRLGKYKKTKFYSTYYKFGDRKSNNISDIYVNTKGSKRFKSDVISAFLSAAVDNEKEQILPKLNINKYTFDAIRAMNQLGFEEDVIMALINQDIVIDFVKAQMKMSDLNAGGTKLTMGDILQDLIAKYPYDTDASIQDYHNPSVDKMMKMIEKGDKSGNDYTLYQQGILEMFMFLTDDGKKIQSIQKAIKSDSAGIGKSIIENNLKRQDVADLVASKDFLNAEKLIGNYSATPAPNHEFVGVDKNGMRVYVEPTSISGFVSVYGIVLSNNLWHDYFPYDMAHVDKMFEEVETLSNVDFEKVNRTEFRQKVWKGFRAYLYSSKDLYEGTIPNIEKKRAELFFDTYKTVIKDNVQTIVHDNKSLATIISEVKETDIGRRNSFLMRLQTDISRGNKPSKVIYNAAASENLDETSVYGGFVDLIVNEFEIKDGYTTRDLADDLILYQLLSGGLQEAIQFTKYIPIVYLNELGIARQLRNINFNKETLFGGVNEIYGIISNFGRQYIQHNPELATLVSKNLNEIEATSGKTIQNFTIKRTPTVVNSMYVNREIDGKVYMVPPEYLRIRNYNSDKGFDLYEYQGNYKYAKIDTLGVFGMNEYVEGSSDVNSLIEGNRAKAVNQTVKEDTRPVGDKTITNNHRVSREERYGLSFDSETGDVFNSKLKMKVALSKIAKNSSNEFYKVYAEQLGNKEFDGVVMFDRNAPTVGRYTNGVITLNPDLIFTDDDFEKVLLHELTHYYADSVIESPKTAEQKQAVNRLHGIFKQAAEKIGQEKINKLASKMGMLVKGSTNVTFSSEEVDIIYGGYDLKEFVTLAMTSPEFQQLLSEISVVKDKTLWEEFVEMFHKILSSVGIKNETLSSVLSDVMILIDNTNNSSTSYSINAAVFTARDVEVNMNLRNADGTRKKYLQKDYGKTFTKVKNVNKNLRGTGYKASIIKVMGEKGDGKVYNAIAVESTSNVSYSIGKDINDSRRLVAIKDRKARIKTLNKKINNAHNKGDKVRLENLQNKVVELENEIERIKKYTTYEQFVALGKRDMAEIDEIFAGNLSEGDIDYVRKIIHLWQKGSQLLLTHNEKVAQIPREELMRIEAQANDRAEQLAEIERDEMEKFIRSYTGKEFDLEQMLRDQVDNSSLSAHTLDLTRTDNIMLQTIGRVIKNANSDALNEAEKIFKKVDEMVEKIRPKLEKFNTNNIYDVFAQTYKDGLRTGDLVHRYTPEYFQKKAEFRYIAEDSGSSKAWARYFGWKRNNEITVNVGKLFPDDVLSVEKYSDADVKKHKKELIETLGQKGYDNIISTIKDNLETFKETREIAFERIDSTPSSQEVKDHEKKVWDMTNSPYWYNKMSDDGKIIKVGDRYIRPAGHKFTLDIPLRTRNGKDTGFYDKRFEQIENDPDLIEFYNFFSETVTNLSHVLPKDKIRRIRENTLPEVRKTIIEEFVNSGYAMKAGMLSMFDKVVEATTASESADVTYAHEDVVTGDIEKSIPIRFVGKNRANFKATIERLIANFVVEHNREPNSREINQLYRQASHMISEEKSYDLGKVLKAYSMMALGYKHKSLIEDKVKLANNILNSSLETRFVDGTDKPLLKEDGESIATETADKSFLNFKKQYSHAMDVFYGQSRAVEGKGKKKVLTSKEKETAKELNKLLEELENKKDKIEAETYESQKATLKEQLDSLGRVRTRSGQGDVVLKAVQLKSMGWNLFSGISNMGFGFISNMVESGDGRAYNQQQIMKAYGMVTSSILKNVTFNQSELELAEKIRSLMDKFDVLKDASQELYKYSSVSKVNNSFKFLSPYQMQKRSEYVNQAPVMIAMMLNTPITDKDGNERTLWEAYDKDGNWKGDEFDALVNTEIRDFKDKLDQIIKNNHGNYDPDTPILLKKKLVGRALIQFRTWMLEGFANRFEHEKYDSLLGYTRRGRYNSLIANFDGKGSYYKRIGGAGGFTIDILYQLFRKLTFQNTTFDRLVDDEIFTEVDAANMRKNMNELVTIISLMSLMLLLKSGLEDEDDDAKKMAYNFFINQGLRLQTDIGFYVDPVSFETLTKNSIPAAGLISDAADWINAVTRMVVGEDEIKSGIYSGHSRLLRETTQLFPFGTQVYRVISASKQTFDK